MPLHTVRRVLIGCLLSLGAVTPSMAQDAAWATFEAGMEAARGQELQQALTLFRRALSEAAEPDLRSAACYAAGDTIVKLFGGNTPTSRALACEGVRHYDCFLHSDGSGAQADVAARATAGRSRLMADCAPSTGLPWTLTAAGLGTLAGGGLLLAASFGDAKALRARKTEVAAAGGMLDGQIGEINSESERIERGAIVGYGLLGAGAFLTVWAILEWADITGGPTGDASRPGSTLSFTF